MKKEILGTAPSIVVSVSIHNSKFQLGVRDNKDTFFFFSLPELTDPLNLY